MRLVNNNYTTVLNMYYAYTDLHAHLSVLTQSLSMFHFKYFEYLQTSSYTKPAHDGVILDINFKVQIVKHSTLTRYTFVDALSRIGALSSSLMIIGKILVNLVNFNKFNFELIKSLFAFEDGVFED